MVMSRSVVRTRMSPHVQEVRKRDQPVANADDDMQHNGTSGYDIRASRHPRSKNSSLKSHGKR